MLRGYSDSRVHVVVVDWDKFDPAVLRAGHPPQWHSPVPGMQLCSGIHQCKSLNDHVLPTVSSASSVWCFPIYQFSLHPKKLQPTLSSKHQSLRLVPSWELPPASCKSRGLLQSHLGGWKAYQAHQGSTGSASSTSQSLESSSGGSIG